MKTEAEIKEYREQLAQDYNRIQARIDDIVGRKHSNEEWEEARQLRDDAMKIIIKHGTLGWVLGDKNVLVQQPEK